MSLASEPDTMSVTRETNETANGAGQNLPTADAVAEVTRSVGRDRKEATPAAERALTASGTLPEHAAAVTAHGANAEPMAHGAEALPSTSPLEAVHRAIETTTLGLERMQNASVSMVLNPDANTQLSLHVKWQQGHFEAQAVLERGDFNALGAHWSQLQNRLAEQGIRLAPLASTSNPNLSFSQNQFSAPRQQQEPAQAVELPVRNLPKSKALNATARPVAAGSAREWWA